MFQSAIFDLDGTLINSLPDIAGAMNRSLAKCGLPGFQVEDYRLKVGNGVFKIAERSVGSRLDLMPQVLSYYMKDYAENCCVDSFVYPGITEALEQMARAGLSLSVFSNKDQGDVERVMRHYFPGITFACIRGRQEGVPLKPAPDGALRIARELGVSPERTLYVGDSMMDMICGAQAGMATVGVTWGFRDREELVEHHARFLIDRPEELPGLIRKDEEN